LGRRRGSWDAGVDFAAAYSRLSRLLRASRGRFPAMCYYAVLLIQLRNGCRVSEAVRAFREFLRSGAVELRVPVSKRRGVERLVVVPAELEALRGEARACCSELLLVPERALVKRVVTWCERKLGFNTHSLRYAFITYLLRSGVNPSIVARITQHARLDYILRYTQEKEAERALRELL